MLDDDGTTRAMTSVELIHADCVDAMQAMAMVGRTVDAIVTDPPYGIGSWDWVHDREYLAGWHRRWAEAALAVLPPGGHMLMFGGTKTYHRMASAVEDAGFEVRDQVVWLYGGGMPKTSPNEDGYAGGLKPAHEPIGVFRKPFKGSAKACYAEHGTSMLNVDACRVATDDSLNGGAYAKEAQQRTGLLAEHGGQNAMRNGNAGEYAQPIGRFPANVVMDEEAAAELDDTTAHLKKGGSVEGGKHDTTRNPVGCSEAGVRTEWESYGDSGGASRFFYCAKASPGERNAGLGESKNDHPTVKPVALMRWLVRLATPVGGTVLDPFMGSGTTGCACALEGVPFVGVERGHPPGDPRYLDIARARIEHWSKQPA